MKKRYFIVLAFAALIAIVTSSLVGANGALVIDFEDLVAGTVVTTLTTGGGGISGDPVTGFVAVNGFDPTLAGNRAMVFDSACPPGGVPTDCSGGDFDLGTPNEAFGGPGVGSGGTSNDAALGNILILSEDLDSSDPDDADNEGSMFEFDFTNFGLGAVTVNSITALDIEKSEDGAKVRVYSDLGVTLIAEVAIPRTGDNGAVTVIINKDDVVFMEVHLNGSGAIDNVVIDEILPKFARITGGGWRVSGTNGESVRSSHGLTLHCDITLSNNLQINWTGGQRWHIDKLVDAAFCEDDPAFTPEPPDAPADTYIGLDVGKLNNDTSDGSVACFIFEDHGEGGNDPDGFDDGLDQALIRIWNVGYDPGITAGDLNDPGFDCSSPKLDSAANLVLSVDLTEIAGGNLQFHFDQPHKNKGP